MLSLHNIYQIDAIKIIKTMLLMFLFILFYSTTVPTTWYWLQPLSLMPPLASRASIVCKSEPAQ